MKKTSTLILLWLSILMLLYYSNSPEAHGMTPPVGSTFDNVVVVAMENQNYADVMGSTGAGNANAPFIQQLLKYGATAVNYQGYVADGRCVNGCSISGFNSQCSAACYSALVSGAVCFTGYSYNGGCVKDGYSCCISATTVIDRVAAAGLQWRAYCEGDGTYSCLQNQGETRGCDHFPFLCFQSLYQSSNIVDSSTTNTASFISAANGSPPNLMWYTPNDCNDMHDNCNNNLLTCNTTQTNCSIPNGDAFLKNFLVGSSGSVVSPGAGSLFARPLFAPGKRTLLVLCWDDFGNAPILFYMPSGVKPGFVSQSTHFDHYSVLRMIEYNWGLATLTSNDAAAGTPKSLKHVTASPL